MRFFLLLIFQLLLAKCQSQTVSCSFLSTPDKSIPYYGECCTDEVVAYLDKSNPLWRFLSVTVMSQIPIMKEKGLCGEVSTSTAKTTVPPTSTVTSSTKLLETTTSSLNCSWLSEPFPTDPNDSHGAYNGSCCTQKALKVLESNNVSSYLNSKYSDRSKWFILTTYLFSEEGACSENYNFSTTVTSSTPTTTLVTTSSPLNCSWLGEPFSDSSIGTYDGSCCTQTALDSLIERNLTDVLSKQNRTDKAKWTFFSKFLFCVEGACSAAYLENCSTTETSSTPTTSLATTSSLLDCSWLKKPFSDPLIGTYDGSCCTQTSLDVLESESYSHALAGSPPDMGSRWKFLSKYLFCVKGACSVTYLENCSTTESFSTSTTSLSTTSSLLGCSWLKEPFSYSSIGVYDGSCCTQTSLDVLENRNFTTLSVSNYHVSAKWFVLSNYLFCVEGACSSTYMENCSTTVTSSTSTTSLVTTSSPLNCSWLGEPFFNSSIGTYDGSCCTQIALDSLIERNVTRALSNYNNTNTARWNFLSKFLFCVEGACSATYRENCSEPTTSIPTTTPPLNCSWLSEPFNFTLVGPDYQYQGSCCTQTALDTIANQNLTTYFAGSNYSISKRWTLISKFLFCTKGACSEMYWDNNCTATTTLIPTISTSSALTISTKLITELNGSTSSSVKTTSSASPSTYQSTSGTIDTSTVTETETSSSTSSSTSSATPIPSSSKSTSTESSELSTTTLSTSLEPSTSEHSSSTSKSTTSSTTLGFETSTVTESTSSIPSTLGHSSSIPKSTTFSSTWSSEPSTTTVSTSSKTSTLERSSSTSQSTTSASRTSTLFSSESDVKTFNTTPPKVFSSSSTHSENVKSTEAKTSTSKSTEKDISTTSTSFKTVIISQIRMKSKNVQNPTTTFNWPTGGTTRLLPSGEIIISESLISYPNCTTVLYQLILNPSTNVTRTETASDPEGCKTTSTTSSTAVTSSKSTETSTTAPRTTTFPWPTGGTTRLLPSGEIIISESLISYPNCTTILYQLILNPSTNMTRTETASDSEGCKTTSTTSVTPSKSNKPSTTSKLSSETTTFNWPTGGTTRLLPSGEIIISESLISYPNCTTILYQLILNPSTNVTRTETVSDLEGCKTTTSRASSTSTTPPETTPFNWPTGGTTRILPSGEIIISESLVSYPNCTTVLYQLILNPSKNTTRTETMSDSDGCKATTSPSPTSEVTTPFNWPTGGTTRLLSSGEIIISESLVSYPNCTTVLYQLILNPSTNVTRTETMSDAEGCKATTPSFKTFESSTTSPGTTTNIDGVYFRNQTIVTFPNCTQKITELTFFVNGTILRNTTMDLVPCKPTTPSSSLNSEVTTPFNWPTGGTTRLLSSGEIIISESLLTYPNCTTVLYQLILNPSTNMTRTETTFDPEGCLANTGASGSTTSKMSSGNEGSGSSDATASSGTDPPSNSTSCAPLTLDLTNTNRPTSSEIKSSYSIGSRLYHVCQQYFVFQTARQPYKIYVCMSDGTWNGSPESCVADKQEL